jgi:hypothetical protein
MKGFICSPQGFNPATRKDFIMDLQHVTAVRQRGDNTLAVSVQTEGFNPGQEVEVSVYLTQGNVYATFNGKKIIPEDSDQSGVLPVELPAPELDANLPLTVVTRVTDVWPTVLQPNQRKMKEIKEVMGEYMDQGLKAMWTYQDAEGK